MSALASILVLAVTIYTTENNQFFVTPAWMPRAVASPNTPGSDDWDLSGNALVSSNSAAAFQAIMDGYCQRAYWFNKAVSNKWNVAQYGGTMPLTFDFPARLNDGDRTIPQDRAVVGLENMRELAENCRFDDYRVYRPSWPCDAFWVSSSVLRCLREGDGGGTSQLDYGLPNSFPWGDGTSYGDLVNRYAVPLTALAPDEFHGERNPAPLLDLWKDICHDDPAITNLTALADDIITNTYDQAVALTFSESPYWKPSGIFTVTNILDKPRAWMGSAARAIAPIDRVYIANRLTGSTRVRTSRYATVRAAMISKQVPVRWKGEGNHDTFEILAPDIDLSSWTVSDTECATNIEERADYYNTLASLRVSPMTGVYDCDLYSLNIINTRGVDRTEAEGVLLNTFPDGSYTFTITTEDIGALVYAVVLSVYNEEGKKERDISFDSLSYERPEFVNISLRAHTTKSYDVVERYQGGREMHTCTRNFADGGEYAFLKACASDVDVYGETAYFWYAVERGSHPGYSLDELISDCAGDVFATVNDMVYQKTHGQHSRPLQYASITESEVRSKGKIKEGSVLANSLMGTISGSFTTSEAAGVKINDDIVIQYSDRSVPAKWSELEFVAKMSFGELVFYDVDGEPIVYGEDEHAAVGDAYLIQSKTFDFDALKIR